MTAPQDIRAYVRKLSAGERKPHHLAKVFEWAREVERGRARLVRDIGDFVHHRRDRGLIWERAGDYAKCDVAIFGGDDPQLFAEGCRASLRLTGKEEAERLLGRPYAEVECYLEAGLRKQMHGPGAHADPDGFLSPFELRALELFNPARTRIGAFTQASLFAQFTNLLRAEHAIPPGDHKRFAKCSNFVTAFCLERMHNRVVILQGIGEGRLYIGNSQDNAAELLALKLSFPLNGRCHVREIMTTDLLARVWAPEMTPGQVPSLGPLAEIVQVTALKDGFKYTFDFDERGHLRILAD